jgi:hypothetical protein
MSVAPLRQLAVCRSAATHTLMLPPFQSGLTGGSLAALQRRSRRLSGTDGCRC